MKSKGISIFTVIFLMILIFIMGLCIGYLIPKNIDNGIAQPKNETNNKAITNTTTNTVNQTNTLTYTNTVTNTTNKNYNIVEGDTTLTETTIANSSNPEEITTVKDLFKKYAKAVNEKDWTTVESLSNKEMVNTLKKYNVTGMLVGDDTIQEKEGNKGGYYCLCSYNVDYNGMSIKDIGLGYIMTADKTNGQFTITDFGAKTY